MKKCSKCKTTDETRFAASQQYRCKNCMNEYSHDNYRLNKDKIRKQSYKRNKVRIEVNRENLRNYLENRCCVDCSEVDSVVLEFDHLSDKLHNISDMVLGSYAWKTILSEIRKCEVVCCNCHRIRTAERAGWSKMTERQKAKYVIKNMEQ